jgi:hypothetical protein
MNEHLLLQESSLQAMYAGSEGIVQERERVCWWRQDVSVPVNRITECGPSIVPSLELLVSGGVGW